MCKGIKELKEMVQDNGMNITGLENMPEIRMSPAPIYYDNPFSENPDDPDLFTAEKRFMTVSRTPNGAIHELNVVSNQYQLVQHYDAIRLGLQSILNDAPEFGKPNVELKFSTNGGVMWAEMRFPLVNEIVSGDPINPRVVLTNSADLKKRFSLAFGAFRVLCSNGLVIPDERFPNYVMIKKLHKQGTLNLKEAIKGMMSGFVDFSETLDVWKGYAALEMKKEQFVELVHDAGFSEKQIADIQSIPLRGFATNNLDQAFTGDRPVNGWIAYNAVTQFITDSTKNPGTELDRNRRISEQFDSLVVA